MGHDGRTALGLSGVRDEHAPGHPVPGAGARGQNEPQTAGQSMRGRGPLRVPLHGHADPARRLDRRARASARDLLNAARATFSGLCAILVGIGLARFAYTPLLPALIAGGWFAPASAAYLGAANLAGYTPGALLASSLVAPFGP